MLKYTLLKFESQEDFLRHALQDFKDRAQESISLRGRFNVVLSGGKTPIPFYEALADAGIDFSRIHIYFVDERYVSKSDPLSNFGMVQRVFLSHVRIPNSNIHSMPTELVDPHEAARLYEISLAGVEFDLVYLGIGKDGRTASLFPGTLLPVNQKVAAFFIPRQAGYRLSMLPGLINSAKQIRMLISGKDKNKILEHILKEPDSELSLEPEHRYPVQLIRPCEILAYAL